MNPAQTHPILCRPTASGSRVKLYWRSRLSAARPAALQSFLFFMTVPVEFPLKLKTKELCGPEMDAISLAQFSLNSWSSQNCPTVFAS
jgi:hypothetical protein